MAEAKQKRSLFIIFGLLAALLGVWTTPRTCRVEADDRQTCELYFAHLADGGGYTTQFLLVNPSDKDINGTLDLFRSDGGPLSLQIDGTTAASFPLTIVARGTLILRSTGHGDPVKIGWARVRSTAAVGGSLIYSFASDGKVIGEAGLDPSLPTGEFCLSVDTRDLFLAGLAIANPNPAVVGITLSLLDTQGNRLAQVTRPIGAMQHFAQLPTEIFPGRNFAGFTGTIVVQAMTYQVIGTTLRFDAGLNVLASIPVIDLLGNPESHLLHFPQIADGAGYSTLFSLVNPGDRYITAHLDLYRQEGTPLSLNFFGQGRVDSFSVLIPGHGNVFLGTMSEPLHRVDVGWARVSADGPIGGSVIYEYASGGRRQSEAGINPAIAVSEFVLAVDRRDGRMSGLAVANPAEIGSVTLFMTLLDSGGRRKGNTATWALQAKKQFAVLLDELFPGVNLDGFTGSLVVKTDGGKVIGTTLRFNNQVSVLSSIPVISGIPIAELPLITTTTSTTTTSTSSSSSTSTTLTLPPLRLVRGSLDSPKNGTTVSGIVNGSGWAALIDAKTGILPAKIELLVDGTVVATALQGIPRPDVMAYFAGLGITVPNDTGYRFSWASFVHAAGAHNLIMQITDGAGRKSNLTQVTTNLPSGNHNLHSVDSIVGNLRSIPAGTFEQGIPLIENTPSFRHTLTKGLAIMETEVTRQMWAALARFQPTLPADPSVTSVSPSMVNPLQTVTWSQAVLFANLLSSTQGLTRTYYKDSECKNPLDATNYQEVIVYCNFDANGFRLPAEGEWEYFARAGTGGEFYIPEPATSSSTLFSCVAGVLAALERVAWFCPNSSGVTHTAGVLPPNPWGLKDVHGNVNEWCWDWYSTYPALGTTDYRGPAPSSGTSETSRTLRGGGYANTASHLRSAHRAGIRLGGKNPGTGFRLVRTLNE